MEKGKEKDTTEFIELPEDISNGMILTLLKNIPPSAPETKVAMLATSSKPRQACDNGTRRSRVYHGGFDTKSHGFRHKGRDWGSCGRRRFPSLANNLTIRISGY